MCVSEIITGEGMLKLRAVRMSNPLWPRVMADALLARELPAITYDG